MKNDIYLIYNNKFKILNKENFRKTIEKTFARKNKFVGNVLFEDNIKCIEIKSHVISTYFWLWVK